jgi:alkanesulfonate monooxygenase SsuD/methylene tetrahydromethanopterin reductase-like flavin-dependent oxidoreductase (luciferase family)
VPDRGRPVTFGWFLIPTAEHYPQLVAQAQTAERLGLEWIGIQDHPYQRRFLDTFTLLALLAAQTERIGLFPDVACLPLRPPAVMAKAAASLDLASGGRVELGLGAGGFWDAIEGMGGPRREPGEAVDALEDAIHITRAMWSGERTIRHQGEHYRIHGIHPGPQPAHEMGIWLGAYRPRMLDLTGRLADGWLPSAPGMPLEDLPAANARIDEAAEQAGRDPAAVRRAYNVRGRIHDEASTGFLDGPPARWVEDLTTAAVDHGMDTFILWADGEPEEQLHRFAEEVAPAVRTEVARRRG